MLDIRSYSGYMFFQGISNSMGMIDNDPRIGSNHTEALPLVEKTIYCATVDQQDILLQVTNLL